MEKYLELFRKNYVSWAEEGSPFSQFSPLAKPYKFIYA